jgi:gliding motility-associated-like protein
MNRFSLIWLFAFALRFRKRLPALCIFLILTGFHGITRAEGTKQLEPKGVPAIANSICKLVLFENKLEYRIPFALVDCDEDYRLNVRISNFVTEKIYLGFGYIGDYANDTLKYDDVSYQVKDPAGNIVAGYGLQPMPSPGNDGFIESRDQVDQGPDINSLNPGGYKPLIINPAMNGDYFIEFKIPSFVRNQIRIIKYFDVTVAKGDIPVPGRLWSKAWQLGSGSVSSEKSASYSLFYIYTNDSIVTRFDCNGMAGGVWNIYSNEWGCATTGLWNNRRQSIVGNVTVQPEYKIFVNDPDPLVFPSGHIGELTEIKVLSECDTVIAFVANVTKAGNIDIQIDIPPLGNNGPEDVKLGYKVDAGKQILLPPWDGKDGYGNTVPNGTEIKSSIRFLNGLSNVPLYDVEDNPKGFKVDIQRPLPVSGNTKLRLFWDDTRLPAKGFPTINATDGCLYSGLDPVSGCHEWKWTNNHSLGDTNTINSWWYLTTDVAFTISLDLKLRPSAGHISGPTDICLGQSADFQTMAIPLAQKYIWHLSGAGISKDFETNAPNATYTQQFSQAMPLGRYLVTVFGRNLQCGDGGSVVHQVNIHKLPEAEFTYGNPCQGAGISFTDQSIPADAPLTEYTWNVKSANGVQRIFYGNPVEIVFDDATNYTIDHSVMDGLGCVDNVTSLITIKAKPVSDFGYTENVSNIPGKLHFENLTTGAVKYYWDFDNSITSQYMAPADITYNLEKEYNIMLVTTNTNGCSDTIIKQYYYMPGFWLPNAFSPDNDGNNDIFRPVTQRTTLNPYNFQVFNRWGQLIFNTTDPVEGWDGTHEGKPCKSGMYSYVIQYREGKIDSSETVTQKGFVSLIR